MKYILNRTEVEEINEILNFRKLWNNIKFALGSSKDEIDTLYDNAFKSIMAENQKKVEISKKYYELEAKVAEIRSKGSRDRIPVDALNDAKKAKDIANSNYIKYKNNIIKNLNLKVDEIKKKKNNPQLDSYANIKRYDLELELTKKEQEAFNSIVDDNILKASDELDRINVELEDKLKKLEQEKRKAEQEAIERQKELSRERQNIEKEKGTGKFDIEEAKKDGNYLWKTSPYYKYNFEPNEPILYWSKSLYNNNDKYKGTKAYIVDQTMEILDDDGEIIEINDNQVKVSREDINNATPDNTFIINKGKIIRTLKKTNKQETTNTSDDGITLELPK